MCKFTVFILRSSVSFFRVLISPMSALRQIIFALVKRKNQKSIIMTKKKLILLDLVKLKDTEEDSAPLIKRFK